MKYLILTALTVATLALGACAKKTDTMSTSTMHSSSTGYSK